MIVNFSWSARGEICPVIKIKYLFLMPQIEGAEMRNLMLQTSQTPKIPVAISRSSVASSQNPSTQQSPFSPQPQFDTTSLPTLITHSLRIPWI
jgi:hypothetical protein